MRVQPSGTSTWRTIGGSTTGITITTPSGSATHHRSMIQNTVNIETPNAIIAPESRPASTLHAR